MSSIKIVSRVDRDHLTQNFSIRIPLTYIIELDFDKEERELIGKCNMGLMDIKMMMNTLIMIIKKVREFEERRLVQGENKDV